MFAVARSMIQYSIIQRHGVIDGLLVQPFLRRNRKWGSGIRQKSLGYQRHTGRSGTTDDFGQDAHDVVEICGGAQAPIPPGGKNRAVALGVTGLTFGIQAIDHRGTHGV